MNYEPASPLCLGAEIKKIPNFAVCLSKRPDLVIICERIALILPCKLQTQEFTNHGHSLSKSWSEPGAAMRTVLEKINALLQIPGWILC